MSVAGYCDPEFGSTVQFCSIQKHLTGRYDWRGHSAVLCLLLLRSQQSLGFITFSWGFCVCDRVLCVYTTPYFIFWVLSLSLSLSLFSLSLSLSLCLSLSLSVFSVCVYTTPYFIFRMLSLSLSPPPPPTICPSAPFFTPPPPTPRLLSSAFGPNH